jgi:hypothetical protein
VAQETGFRALAGAVAGHVGKGDLLDVAGYEVTGVVAPGMPDWGSL